MLVRIPCFGLKKLRRNEKEASFHEGFIETDIGSTLSVRRNSACRSVSRSRSVSLEGLQKLELSVGQIFSSVESLCPDSIWHRGVRSVGIDVRGRKRVRPGQDAISGRLCDSLSFYLTSSTVLTHTSPP